MILCFPNSERNKYFKPMLWIQKHWIWIRIQDFGPIWIQIQEAPEYGSGSTTLPKFLNCEFFLNHASSASILIYICMCGSGSVFGIRIRIQESPEYGFNTDPDPGISWIWIQYGSGSRNLLNMDPIRIRIQESPEYGSNTDQNPDPQHCFKHNQIVKFHYGSCEIAVWNHLHIWAI